MQILSLKTHFLTGASNPVLAAVMVDTADHRRSILVDQRCTTSEFAEPFLVMFRERARAVAAAFVEAKRLSLSGTISQPVLEGPITKSAASAVAYALKKQPLWVKRLMGAAQDTEDGHALLNRALRIENGRFDIHKPVRVFLRNEVIHPRAISIYLDGELITDAPILRKLKEDLLSTWDAGTTNIKPSTSHDGGRYVAMA